MKINELNSAEFIKTRIIDNFITSSPNIIIGNEVMYGIDRRVVDLLVILNKKLIAIEIKSSNDNFKRLEYQIESYRKTFNYIYLVITEKDINKIDTIIPNDIGIYYINNKLNIMQLRKAKLQKEQVKLEMLGCMSYKYLKQINSKYKKMNSDEIRFAYEKTNMKNIQNMLTQYYTFRIEPKYKLFLSERGFETHVEDIFILSYTNKTII